VLVVASFPHRFSLENRIATKIAQYLFRWSCSWSWVGVCFDLRSM